MFSMTVIWLIFGSFLMFLEFFLPGLVVIFLGLGAFTVALLNWLGIVDSWTGAITAWFASSLFFLIVLRTLLIRLFPGDICKTANFDEDREAFGAIVEVIEPVDHQTNSGRIRFQGTTWSAKCIEGNLQPGQKAQIVFRDDLTYVIEPCLDIDPEEG